MKKVAFYTLGCKLNFSETSSISRLFEQRGYEKVDFHQPADIYVINTCSVTEHADKKCRKVVKEALKHSPEAYIAIMGCYAQLKPDEIATIPGVDAVLGASEKFRLLDVLDGFQKKETPQIFKTDIKEVQQFTSAWSANDRTRTFLKVQDGCDYTCSFCTIPLARGKSRSGTIADIIATAKEIAENDVKEIVLTGVNIGDFGLQNGERKEYFYDLIQALDAMGTPVRFRISSIEPNLLTPEIVSFVATSRSFVPHFHIPLQSGSNKILKLMRRRYQRELYAQRIQEIKSVMPHCCIGVDVIVGFPGETDSDFLETYQFLNELEVSYLHVFTYSERANTHALSLPGRVQESKRAERSKMLHILSDKKRRAFYEQHVGTVEEVLFEEEIENGQMFGFTRNYIKVSAKYDPVHVNEVKKIRLTSIFPDGTVGVEDAEEEILAHVGLNASSLQT